VRPFTIVSLFKSESKYLPNTKIVLPSYKLRVYNIYIGSHSWVSLCVLKEKNEVRYNYPKGKREGNTWFLGFCALIVSPFGFFGLSPFRFAFNPSKILERSIQLCGGHHREIRCRSGQCRDVDPQQRPDTSLPCGATHSRHTLTFSLVYLRLILMVFLIILALFFLCFEEINIKQLELIVAGRGEGNCTFTGLVVAAALRFCRPPFCLPSF